MKWLLDILDLIGEELLALAMASDDKKRIGRMKALQKKLREARDKRTGIKP